MTVEKDFLIATLAIDAYNRGYDSGLLVDGQGDADGLGENSDGTLKISSATVSHNLENAGIANVALDDGFYAIAYETDYGTVISYRGTDSFFGTEIAGNDGFNGYGIALGEPGGPQYNLLIEFYKSVVASKLMVEDPNDLTAAQLQNSGVIVTGHSLGAGLAGVVAGLYGLEGPIFDNMPFQLAVEETVRLAKGVADGSVPEFFEFQDSPQIEPIANTDYELR